jgi:hypothetical protein
MSWLRKLQRMLALPQTLSNTSTGIFDTFTTDAFTPSSNDMQIPHRRYKGSTGSGKTNAASVDILGFAKRGDYWITAVYPHPQAGELLIAELFAIFGEAIFDRLIVERLSDTDRVIPRQFIFSSSDADPYQKAIQDDEYRGAFVDILLPSQEKATLGDQPSKLENLNLAISAKQKLDTWISDSWTHHLLEKHPVNEFAKLHLPGDFKIQLEAIDSLDPKSRLMGPGSAVRLMKPVMGSPVIQVRTFTPESHDDVEFKNKGGIRIILGGDVSKDALRVLVGADFQRTVRDAKRRLLNPGIYFVDEATNYGLYGQFESDALSTVRAFNISMWHAIQSENYPTQDIKRNVAQNVDDYIFLQRDPDEAFNSARTLNAARDLYEIHHEDVSYRSVDTDEFITRKGKSVTKGEKGKSVTESEQLIQKKREEEVRRQVYNPLTQQTERRSDQLMILRTGECWVNARGRAPYRMQVPLFPDSWAFPGLAQAKADECIRLLKQRLPYRTPVAVPFPVLAKTTTSSGGSGKNRPSQNLPKPPGRPGNWSKKK